MTIDTVNNGDITKLLNNLIQQDKQERIVTAALTCETLAALNISTTTLPQRTQQLLLECTTLLNALDLENIDPIAISIRKSKEISQKLADEYELLELRQKNAELQVRIDRNKKVLEELRKELQSSKDSLAKQNPNPENIEEHLRQMKQKLASYEEIYEKAKVKFSKLQVPDAILPKSIEELASRLAALKEEEASLRQRAEDITLARQARDTLCRLRRP